MSEREKIQRAVHALCVSCFTLGLLIACLVVVVLVKQDWLAATFIAAAIVVACRTGLERGEQFRALLPKKDQP